MPVETGRTTKRKRITLPSGGTVDIPVITEITFVDPSDRYQEITFTVDNSAQGGRTVHVVNLHGDVDGDLTQVLPVERIDTWPVLDKIDRGQETQASLDNVTGEDAQPYPHFSTHFVTHNVTYTSSLDNQAAIITELIDELHVLDPIDRGQETRFVLTNNPPAGVYTLGTSDANIADTANGIDPPWRTDPFQNIVAWRDTMGHPPPPWYGAQAYQEGVVIVLWNPGPTPVGPPDGGDICFFQDSPTNSPLGNFGRPLSYGLCDWPIATPLDPPPPQVVPWGTICYSAGTLYKKRSEFEEAFAHTRSPVNADIEWAFSPIGGAGGPDGSPATGALAAEINTYCASWAAAVAAAQADDLYYPWRPVFRIFFIEDDHFETWMAGIHDPVDVPPLP